METNRIEYKQKLPDQLEKEVVAFLNYTGGGIIILGVDKNGVVTGVGGTVGFRYSKSLTNVWQGMF